MRGCTLSMLTLPTRNQKWSNWPSASKMLKVIGLSYYTLVLGVGAIGTLIIAGLKSVNVGISLYKGKGSSNCVTKDTVLLHIFPSFLLFVGCLYVCFCCCF